MPRHRVLGLGGATVTSTQDNLAVLKLAKSRGLDPTKLGPVQFAILALEAQGGPADRARAVRRATSSRVRTGVFGRVVPGTQSTANAETCAACPHGALSLLRDGTKACTACGCQGAFLESKWKDPIEFCPLTVSGAEVCTVGFSGHDPPTWSNLEVPDA